MEWVLETAVCENEGARKGGRIIDILLFNFTMNWDSMSESTCNSGYMEAMNLPWWGYPYRPNPYSIEPSESEEGPLEIDMASLIVSWAYDDFLSDHTIRPLRARAQGDVDSMVAIVSTYGPFPHDPTDLCEASQAVCQRIFSTLGTEDGEVAARYYGLIGNTSRRQFYKKIAREAAEVASRKAYESDLLELMEAEGEDLVR